MKKIFSTIVILGLLFVVSCSRDYLDVNQDSNLAYNSQLTPRERLAAAQTTIYATQAVTLNTFGNLMMNSWAGNVHYYASPFANEFSMKADSNFYDEIWDRYYAGIYNYQVIIDTPNASTKYPHHVAIAKVMKAYYMQTIVDLYNDAIYSEGFKGQGNLYPKYDKGADIYKKLIAEVNEANTLLNATTTNAVAATEDVIMAGNIANWKKMANTVKLKLLVRLSKCTDPSIVALVATELPTMPTASTSYVDADVTINPGYSNAAVAQQNPFYRTYGLVDIGIGDYNATYRLVFASSHIIDNMLGRVPKTTGLTDVRVSKMFLANGVANYLNVADPTTAGYYGLQQGSVKDPSRVESDFCTLGTSMFFRGSSTGSAQNGFIMTHSESKLLQAEAGISYPSSGFAALAQTNFNAGVTASFTTLGLTAAQATAYLALSNTKPGVGWTASTNKLEPIQYQRWIALTNINPTETYIEYTKTGFPVTPMPLGAYKPTRPLRLMYPQSEFIANSANVPNLGLDDVFNLNQYSPFWLK